MSDTPRIILDLVGGSEDGIRYASPIANAYYWQADHGRVGARFQLVPEARFLHQIKARSEPPFFDPAHIEIYEIEERRDEWDHIYLRAQYLGRADTIPADPVD